MSILKILIINIIFTICLITCETVDGKVIEENKAQLIDLSEEEDNVLLLGNPNENKKMYVELMFSHPSYYDIVFNKYDELEVEPGEDDELNAVMSRKKSLKSEEALNSNIFYLNEDSKGRFINPKRRLASLENDTDIVESDKSYYGRSKLVLNSGKSIALTVFRDSEEELKSTGQLFIKYKNYDETPEEKFKAEDNELEVEQSKDILSISFDGVTPKDEDMDLQNVTVDFTAKLYDLDKLSKKYENIFMYSVTKEDQEVSKEIKVKGNMITKSVYLKMKAPLIEDEQILLVNAIVKDKDEDQYIQYKPFRFTVEEESDEREWPEEEEKEEEKEKEREKEKEKEGEKQKEKEKEKELSNEEIQKRNRKENKLTLTIILICFAGAVLVTFIGVFIYIKCCRPKEENIEEDKDYKDVGGIVKNEDKNEGNTDEGKKINEEEE